MEYPFFFQGRVLLNVRYLTCTFAQGPKRPKVDLLGWVQCQEHHGAPRILTWVVSLKNVNLGSILNVISCHLAHRCVTVGGRKV